MAIVTTRAADGRNVGLTINSFASLSLDPPLVLWSLVNRSPNLAVFRDSAHFAINILASGHEALARRFADPAVPDKFADVTVRETPEGVAAIDGALATWSAPTTTVARWATTCCWSARWCARGQSAQRTAGVPCRPLHLGAGPRPGHPLIPTRRFPAMSAPALLPELALRMARAPSAWST